MRRLLPSPADDIDVGAEYAIPEDRRWVRANMVATVDGAVADSAGLSGGISGPADRRMFSVLRSLADVIVVGASTAQAEQYRRSKRPIAILSRTLDLDLSAPLLGPATEERPGPVILVAPAAAWDTAGPALRDHAESVGGIAQLIAGADTIDLAEALRGLHESGARHLLCEGGPSLLSAFVAQGLLDELCLTTSPLLLGGEGGRILGREPIPDQPPWALAGLYAEDDFLFARWQAPHTQNSP